MAQRGTRTDGGSDDMPIRDAATVMVARDGSDGLEVLVVRRTRGASFAAGAIVFPGGAVDEADSNPDLLGKLRGRRPDAAARAVGSDRGLAFWAAAVRETFEESGVLLVDGDRRLLGPSEIAGKRHELADGTLDLGSLLTDIGDVVDVGRIAYVARWVTPLGEARRFDTRFFLALVPDHTSPSHEPVHDGIETTEAFWIRPAEALDRSRAGEFILYPPTVANLRWLSAYANSGDALHAGLAMRVEVVRPELVRGPDGTMRLHLAHGDDEAR